MIIELPDTTTSAISKKLVSIREAGGEVTTGRVLTLIVVASINDDMESVITAANDASREHPSRVLVVLTDPEADNTAGGHQEQAQLEARSIAGERAADDPGFVSAAPVSTSGRVDAQIRVGGDAGASEVVVMTLYGAVAGHVESVVTPLLLPDTPIVAWWPVTPPPVPAEDPIGRIASRRITDSLEDSTPDGLYLRRTSYTPGDSDLAWSRITQWRGILASALDQPPFDPIVGATITGPEDDPSVDIAAGWLADRLGMNVTRLSSGSPKIPVDSKSRPMLGIEKVEVHRASGDVVMETLTAHTVRITRDGSEHENLVALTRRSTADCLAEELRHLDPDVVYGKALRGLSRVRSADAFVY